MLRILPLLCLLFQISSLTAQETSLPNIILIMTDDQGYGDFGFTGNSKVNTPNLDQLAGESQEFTNFHVSPVCAPTRASLMTGRYSLRTGVRDTYNGGSTMASNEITIAELLKIKDYRTGIFGKWHLGDNYPFRPIDQGFDESVIHLAGGMGQVGDITSYFKFDSSYYDPVLWHNGEPQKYEGYCTNIFADEAINFIEKNKEGPFFCYLSFNAPHTPLQVPKEYYEQYKDLQFEEDFMSERDKEDARKVYAMVTNIDDNIGKLRQTLTDLDIAENTVIIFLTDNGPQQYRYTAGLREKKGSVYDGGVRTPLLVRHPAINKSEQISNFSAHIDIFPTIAQLCGIDLPLQKKIDGRSLLPLLMDKSCSWKDRHYFSYWIRRYPELYRNTSIQKGHYKLVGQTGFDSPITSFELYDLKSDPAEKNNIIEDNIGIATELKNELDKTYDVLLTSENIQNPPHIIVGSNKENPTILNRNDAGGERGLWDQEEVYGHWMCKIQAGTYDITYKFIKPLPENGAMLLEVDKKILQKPYSNINGDIIVWEDVQLGSSEGPLYCHYAHGLKNILPFWVELKRID